MTSKEELLRIADSVNDNVVRILGNFEIDRKRFVNFGSSAKQYKKQIKKLAKDLNDQARRIK